MSLNKAVLRGVAQAKVMRYATPLIKHYLLQVKFPTGNESLVRIYATASGWNAETLWR